MEKNGDFSILLCFVFFDDEKNQKSPTKKRIEKSPFFSNLLCFVFFDDEKNQKSPTNEKKNGEISILFGKEWRFLHSFVFCFFDDEKNQKSPTKKKEKSPFFSNLLCLFFLMMRKIKNLQQKKEWRNLHSFWKRMEISPFFCVLFFDDEKK